jgi:tRNA(Arg) A34 adenosine deaminase TadA
MCLGAIYWARLDRVYYANTRIEAAAIGFDDDHIYREFDKPIDGRAVPFIQLGSEEARQIFKEWLEKPDKIPY